MKVPKKVGILGGGQLARMLILEGHRLGLEMHVLCSANTEPAAQVCAHTSIGNINSRDDVGAFCKNLDAVTFESEFVDTSICNEVSKNHSQVQFYPSISAIHTVQDRLTQKQLLDRHKIPTASWLSVSNEDELQKAASKFKKGFVLKKRRFGYDGYGTYIVRELKDEHVSLLKENPYGFIAEEFISFKRELATTVARSKSDIIYFPLVETKQADSRCLWVKGPVKHKDLSAMQKKIRSLMKDLSYEGVMAFEMFETTKGLIVNELAPRVHNSAHYSLDALSISQFELHLRAGLNWQMANPIPLTKGFAMMNLLGEGASEVKLSTLAMGKLHWYGKTENKIGRKMGHLNCIGKSADHAVKNALRWRKDFKL